MFIPESENAIKIYEQKNAIYKNAQIGNYYISEEKFDELKGFQVFPNDIIVSCAGTIGETYVMPKEIRTGIINQALMRIKLYNYEMIDFYLMYFDFMLKKQANEQGKGTAIKNIPPFDILKNFLLPLPPLEEQCRIRDFIQEINEEIDCVDSDKNIIFALVAQAKSKILDLAIRGKLVPQDPNDEPASVLLERIKAKHSENKKKASRTSDNSHYENLPFEIPKSWVWVRGYSCFNPMESTKPKRDNFRYIDIDAIDNKSHKVINPKAIKREDAPSRATRKLSTGDTLFSMVRPYLENIAFIDNSLNDCIASTGFYVCKPNGLLFPIFCFNLMTSQYVIDGLNSFMKGDNSPSINNENILNWLYPIPPFEEQIRITKAINSLYSMLDNILAEL